MDDQLSRASNPTDSAAPTEGDGRSPRQPLTASSLSTRFDGGPTPKLTEKDGKTMQRLTLAEAAEEIKRLRRLARQNKSDLQKKDEEQTALQHTLSQLQSEMRNAQRAAEKKIREKEREADELRKQLDQAAEDLRILQSSTLPLNEARKLTYKALRKGRALECLGELFCRNTVTNRMLRQGFNAIVENAFGAAHLAYRAEHGVGPGVSHVVDSQLRLLRQEQLLLLAENERLNTQLLEVQGALVSKRQTLSETPQDGDHTEPNAKEHSPAADGDTDVERRSGMLRKIKGQIIKAAFEVICGILRTARLRLLAVSMRKLACFAVHETGVLISNIANAKATTTRNQVNFLLGTKLLGSFLRTFICRRERLGFYRLVTNAIQDKRIRRPVGQGLGNFSDPSTAASDGVTAPPGADPSPGLFRPSLGAGSVPLGGLPAFVYQPHYYGRLPSTQTRRSANVFFPAPHVPACQAELKLQALSHNSDICDPIYRPAPELSAIASPAGRRRDPLVSDRYLSTFEVSRETKLRRRELQGALLKPSATPDDEPLSASKMNDMYIDMLLDEVDRRQ
uniref:Uncharacterized protein n=1 Tax=Neospora caninum (strain Liverpool) TaxID=572307 RepID=A0A0F7UCI5_NEOCL|nr:TPA: hypothetical protein BN1204_033580 [Neospora caninum Liverpool]